MHSTLRSIGFVVLTVGAVFKLQHWPFADVFLVVAWITFLVAFVVQLAGQGAINRTGLSRDLFFFGIISLFMLTAMHWPGRWAAYVLVAFGGLGWLVFGRRDLLPSKSEEHPRMWILIVAVALSVAGVLGLLGSYALIAAVFFWGWWFIVPRRRKGQ